VPPRHCGQHCLQGMHRPEERSTRPTGRSCPASGSTIAKPQHLRIPRTDEFRRGAGETMQTGAAGRPAQARAPGPELDSSPSRARSIKLLRQYFRKGPSVSWRGPCPSVETGSHICSPPCRQSKYLKGWCQIIAMIRRGSTAHRHVRRRSCPRQRRTWPAIASPAAPRRAVHTAGDLRSARCCRRQRRRRGKANGG
jgi:hypothetical protein